jgi:DNA-binding transcriptional MerR regulator
MPDTPRAHDTYLQIGDAAERTGLTQRTLRYYEEKGLLKSPSRMEGGFRLYSDDDLDRLERIKELKDLLGFSLADIKEMLEADDVRLQLREEWRKDVDAAEKAVKMRMARDLTVQQLAMIDQKVERMAALRDKLAERIGKYDAAILQYTSEAAETTDTPAGVPG